MTDAFAPYDKAVAASTSPPAAHQHIPSALFNGMIQRLTPFAIRGAIWYQGEGNVGDGMLYYRKMRALIGGWRQAWGEGQFPFLYVQLAPYDYGMYKGPKDPYLLRPSGRLKYRRPLYSQHGYGCDDRYQRGPQYSSREQAGRGIATCSLGVAQTRTAVRT